MATPTNLPVIDRTNINTEEQITFCNSPIHLRLQNGATDTTIESATVYLWIWNGAQNKTLGSPNHILYKDKVSASDNYINFEISQIIKSFLIAPPNAPNTHQPTFAYNELSNPTITGQGVFWQIVTDITSAGITVRSNYTTAFATLGYRWNYEQNIIANNGLSPNGSIIFQTVPNRWYNPKIHNYISQSFNLTNTVATATTANMITVTDITPPDAWKRCCKDPYLIVYLNKLGLWDMFTPNGKVAVSSKKEATTSNINYRDPGYVDNSFQHSKVNDNFDVTQSYSINTGMIEEEMDALVEEIIYSPKIYLIKFKGDLNLTTTVGITIDNNIVTVDSLLTTIDGLTVSDEYLAFYKTHQQIPVILTDTDFERKTRLNNRVAIDYTLKFEETTNKINDIR